MSTQKNDGSQYAPKPPAAVAAQAARADEMMRPQEPEQENQPEQETPPEPPAPQPPSPPQQAQETDWEHQFKSAQGRLQTQMQANRQLSERMASMEQLLASLQAKQDTVPTMIAPVASRLITPEEEANFGTEMLTVMEKKAREAIGPDILRLQEELKQAKDRLAAVGNGMQVQQQRSVIQELSAQVPDWRQQDQDPGFIAWLQEWDPLAGRIRQQMLEEARDGHDANRVVSFFKAYRSEAAAIDPPAPSAPSPQGKRDLRSMAAPGRATSAPARAAADSKPVYTNAHISQFYALRNAGKFKGREAEADAIEADIFAAQREGRIRP